MRKKEIITLCMIFAAGLAMGFFVRYLSLNGYHADTVEQSGFTVARGTIIRSGSGFSLSSVQLTSGQALLPNENIAIVANSPSIDFNQFVDHQVRVEGTIQDGAMAVVAIYSL